MEPSKAGTMATTAPSPEPVGGDRATSLVEADGRAEWIGIGWAGYRAMLRIQGERSRPQLVYLDGDLLLMSPSYDHEWLKKRLAQFVLEVAVGLAIPFIMAGETTLRRRKKRGGVQPDESFYFANWAPIAAKKGRENINLRFDPPPDLAIEVVYSHDAKAAVEVLRRLGVPEVWVGDEGGLSIRILQANGRYIESDTSLVFPFLTATEIHEWATRPGMDLDMDWIREVRRRVQDDLAPRVRRQGK